MASDQPIRLKPCNAIGTAGVLRVVGSRSAADAVLIRGVERHRNQKTRA
jgi:hypothetical protein